jgi:hypothetical protein
MGRSIVNRVYKIDELITIFGDIIENYVNQVVLMSDEELEEDRGAWIKKHSGYKVEDKDNYDISCYTVAIEIEQIRRGRKIVYDIPKKNIRLD